ncbi:MAG: sigma-70 family RNA polymerase sigma factor [Deltaproteobacteria bacterium]
MDKDALTQLYREYGPVVYRRARFLLDSDEEARDAMQEVFLRVARSHDTFRGDAPVLHWMYRVTTNLCLNRLRQAKRHPVVHDPEAVRRLTIDADDPADRQAVLFVLSRCDALTQSIAVHYHLDGMKMEEVASVVGCSRKTVGKKLAAFSERARRLLEDAR